MKTKLLIILSLITIGCASKQEKFAKKYCNYESANTLGMSHATSSKPSSVGAFAICSQDDRLGAVQGYNDGYAKGKELLISKDNAKKIIFEIDQK